MATRQYTYSDDGLRKSRFDGTTTTNFTYDEVALLLETDNSANLGARYTGYPGVWGGLASQRRGSTSSFYGFDSQHSARILTSAAGAVTDALSFKAFGEALATGTTVNPFGYVALYLYYTDDDGNMAVGPRILVPANGIWMPRDPIGLAGGSYNEFEYVRNEPVGRVDPSGLVPVVGPGCYEDDRPAGPGTQTLLNGCCKRFHNQITGGMGDVLPAILACMAKKNFGDAGDAIRTALRVIESSCQDPATSVCVWCWHGRDPGTLRPGDPGQQPFAPPPGWPASCPNPCHGLNDAWTPLPMAPLVIDPKGTKCLPLVDFPGCEGLKKLGGTDCTAAVALCLNVLPQSEICTKFFHELIHVGGLAGLDKHHRQPNPAAPNGSYPGDDFIYALECCLCQVMNPGSGGHGACYTACGSFGKGEM